MTQDNLFTPSSDSGLDNAPDTRDFLSELVGEGRKFKNPSDLAKGKIEADTFIEKLKSENATLREDLSARKKLEELIEKLATTPNHNDDGSQHNQTADIDEILEQKLSEYEQRKQRQQNLDFVKNKLKEYYGDDYVTTLKSLTKDLGLTNEAINEIAKSHPHAALKLLKTESRQTDVKYSTPPVSSVNIGVNPGSSNSSGERNMSYYDKIKNADKKKYWSKEVQAQMHKDAVRLGEKFFQQ